MEIKVSERRKLYLDQLELNNVYDLIIRFCFVEGIYSLTEVNSLLDSYECKLFSY